MKTKMRSYKDAPINIENVDSKLAIFDVSQTIECLWVAISNQEADLLQIIGGNREAMEFVAREQINGATIKDDGLLDKWANADGFDHWIEYVAGACSDERPEFPVYYDAQGREHAEF